MWAPAAGFLARARVSRGREREKRGPPVFHKDAPALSEPPPLSPFHPHRSALAAAAAAHPAAARTWLGPALATDAGTVEFYGLLEQSIGSPAFAARLEAARGAASAAGGGPGGSACPSGTEVLRPDWWEEPTVATAAQPPAAAPSPAASPERLDSYVLVDRADVADAVAAFVAAYLATLPDAAALPAPQLAEALGTTLRELRKGRAARLWGWGKALYRAAAVVSAGFGAYTHPWLARALLAAVWTGARALCGWAGA